MTQYYLSQVTQQFDVEEITDVVSVELWENFELVAQMNHKGVVSNEFYETPSSDGGEKIIVWLYCEKEETHIGEILVSPKGLTLFYY